MDTKTIDIAIIGGGITGLSCLHSIEKALETAALPLQCALFESSNRFGGTIDTAHQEGFILEKGPDAFLSTKLQALNLIKVLGGEDKIISTNTQDRRSFIACKGVLQEVPTGFSMIAPSEIKPFLTSSLLSASGKLRMLMDFVIPAKKGDADESVATFMRRRFGKEALERIGQPMVAGIYTGDPEKISAQYALQRFVKMEKINGSIIRSLMFLKKNSKGTKDGGPRYSLFLSMKEGMNSLVELLLKGTCEANRHLNYQVKTIGYVPEKKQWQISFTNDSIVYARAICLAASSFHSQKMLGSSNLTLSNLLSKIPSESVITMNLAFDRKQIGHALNGFGFVSPAVEKSPLVACSFSSMKFSNRAPKGKVLLRAFIGGYAGRSYLELSEEELTLKVINALKSTLRVAGNPLFTTFSHYKQAMPQYHIGHDALIESIRGEAKKSPGLFLGGSSYNGVGIPDCIQQGQSIAEQSLKFLQKRP